MGELQELSTKGGDRRFCFEGHFECCSGKESSSVNRVLANQSGGASSEHTVSWRGRQASIMKL